MPRSHVSSTPALRLAESYWAFALLAASILVSLGTGWAFQRGAHDFAVFHHVWGMVSEGRGAEIYDPTRTPDRFLYAPGFAWLLAPLGRLPFSAALALWCLAKAAAIAFVIRAVSMMLRPDRGVEALGIGAGAFLLLARPFLIDLQYGQVNSFILASVVWPLFRHQRTSRASAADFAAWALLAVAAVTKIFPGPLLLIPWLAPGAAVRDKLRRERAGVIFGVALMGVLPALSQGLGGLPPLYQKWMGALLAKGLPLESHNQSFIALLHHYFSGEPTFVIAEGWPALPFGTELFSSHALAMLSFAWTWLALGGLLAWLFKGPRTGWTWAPVLIALLIVPSHLIWKPYFVLGLPVAAVVLAGDPSPWVLPVIFAAVNLTGFDFLGHQLAAHFEAAATLFLAHMLLIGRALRISR